MIARTCSVSSPVNENEETFRDPRQSACTTSENDQRTNQALLRRRQALRITLAFFLIWIAVTSTAKASCIDHLPESCLLQFDGFTPVPDLEHSRSVSQSQHQANVQLFAELANFDRDADADGWRVSLAIQDPAGVLVKATGQASFQILELPQRRYRHATRRELVSSPPLARWSVPVHLNELGVAHVNLPASWAIQRRLGWHGVASVHQGTRVASRFGATRQIDQRWSDGPVNYRRFVTHDLRDRIDYATRGWLFVRVSMPGQPTLEAITPVDTRPAFLVDIPSRYR